MDFKYEPISPASQEEYPLIISNLEEMSDTFPLKKQEEFYPELYSVHLNNVILDTLAPNLNTQTHTSSFSEYQPLATLTSNYTEDIVDISQLLKFSPNLNSGSNEKDSSGGIGPIRTKRTRTSYTRYQVGELERAFEINPYLTAPRRIQLAKELNIGESQVKVWFQNRRCRAKRHYRKGEGSAADNILPLDVLPLAASPTPPTTIRTATTVIQPIAPTQSHILANLPLTPLATPTTTPVTTPTTTPSPTPPSSAECSELEEIMDFILDSMDEMKSRQESIEEIQFDLELSAHIFLLSSQQNVKLY